MTQEDKDKAAAAPTSPARKRKHEELDDGNSGGIDDQGEPKPPRTDDKVDQKPPEATETTEE